MYMYRKPSVNTLVEFLCPCYAVRTMQCGLMTELNSLDIVHSVGHEQCFAGNIHFSVGSLAKVHTKEV